MTTLIEIRDVNGLVGRCDAKCYDAENDNCKCICGGYNHGVGIEAAKENTRKTQDLMISEAVELFAITDYEVMVNVTVVNQLNLLEWAAGYRER
jgi:hypothetical protein